MYTAARVLLVAEQLLFTPIYVTPKNPKAPKIGFEDDQGNKIS